MRAATSRARLPAPEQCQPCRCQRTTVSGLTIARCSRQPAHQRRARTHSSLSQVRSRARGCVRVGRVRIASWWRRSRCSATRSRRGRSQAKAAVSTSQSSSSTLTASPTYTRPRICRPTGRLPPLLVWTSPLAEPDLADVPGQPRAPPLGSRPAHGADPDLQDAVRAGVHRPRPA